MFCILNLKVLVILDKSFPKCFGDFLITKTKTDIAHEIKTTTKLKFKYIEKQFIEKANST